MLHKNYVIYRKKWRKYLVKYLFVVKVLYLILKLILAIFKFWMDLG